MAHEDYRPLLEAGYHLEERAAFLLSLFNEWRRAQEFPEGSIHAVPVLVEDVVLNYFADIDRLKKFHNLKRANLVKVAAYTVSWWLRIKPIHIRTADPAVRSDYILLNELFAIDLLLALLYDRSQLIESNPEKFNLLTREWLYHFHHRTTDPQAIELALSALGVSPPFEPKPDSEEDGD